MSDTPSTESLNRPILVSLPENLFIAIATHLCDRDVCMMELANTRIHHVLSQHGRPWPCERRLNLLQFKKWLPTPETFRWLQRRSWRYSHIVCKSSAGKLLEGRKGSNKRNASCAVPPLLPSLLGACAPSARLSLTITRGGRMLIAMAMKSMAPGAGPELSSFGAHLKHHLTELEVPMKPGRGKAQHLEVLGRLTALQKLKAGYGHPSGDWHELCGETVALKLPHLVSLALCGFGDGEVVLSCPKLAEAQVWDLHHLRIWVEDEDLTSLYLADCKGVQIAPVSPEGRFQNLRKLEVYYSSEVGRHLIEYAGQMSRLEELRYRPVPAACMPAAFPQSLRTVELYALDWSHNLPAGLVQLNELETISFNTDCREWDIERPLPELLPIDSLKLKPLSLGCHWYHRSEDKGPLQYSYTEDGEGIPRRCIML